jgi:hypothetical protein
MKIEEDNKKRRHLPALARRGATICLALAFSMVGGALQAVPPALNVPGLGAASRFTVLSATPNNEGTVTSTTSTITGDVGSSGGLTSVIQTGGTITGSIIAPVTTDVLADFNRAYDTFALVPCDQVLTGTMDGITLPPGVYCFDAAAALTGQLTLNGSANGIWIFKIGGGLTGTGLARVVMAGGAQPSNVYWSIGGAATLTDSSFVGTILAGANITITRGTFTGKALAKGAVTLTDAVASKDPASGLRANAVQARDRLAR